MVRICPTKYMYIKHCLYSTTWLLFNGYYEFIKKSYKPGYIFSYIEVLGILDSYSGLQEKRNSTSGKPFYVMSLHLSDSRGNVDVSVIGMTEKEVYRFFNQTITYISVKRF